jgi:hypothetical protein
MTKTKTALAKIALAIKITCWLITACLKWIGQASPKTELDFYRFTLLLLINYLIAIHGFIPFAQALMSEVWPRPQVVVKEVVKEVYTEIEPTDPDAWVAWRIAKAGLNPLEAAVVQVNESGYTNNDNRFNVNTNGSVDLGRWQWNSLHIKSGHITIECAGNYRCSTEKAIEARLKDGSWSVKWFGARKAGL